MTEQDITNRARTGRVPVRLLLFGLVAVASVALGFLVFNVDQSRVIIRRYGYYAISVIFAWGVYAFYRLAPVALGAVRALTPRQRWQIAGVIGGCTLVAVLTTPLNYKILYDEMVLQATATGMHTYRDVGAVMRAYTVDGVFVPLDSYVDKRPLFYPYLVSLLHDLTGYRERNAIFLNLALMPVLLAQLYFIARRFAAHAGAIVAVVTLGTLSTFVHSGTGAGMETLNLVMILATIQFGTLYLESPDAPRLAALILSAVLLAESRYESALYVLPVAIIALEGWRRLGRTLLPPAAIAAPALLVPYAIHNTYLSGTPVLWELHDNAQARFGFSHLQSNLEHAYRHFFNLNATQTNSLWLSSAGALALGYAIFRLWRARRVWRAVSPAVFVIVLMGAGICANLGLLMFYYWGQLDDPTVTRLGLPFAALLAIAIAFAVDRFSVWQRNLAWYASAAAVLAYLWSGVIANAQHSLLNTLQTELDWERRFVDALPPGERLIISDKSTLPWILGRIPAISIDRARTRVDALRFQLANHTFREILVFQDYRPTDAMGDYQLDAKNRLPDWFALEPITEKRFGTRLDRVSRLVEIRKEAAPAAAK